MRCHANARLSPIGRRLLVDRVERDGWPVRVAAEAAGVSTRTAAKWVARWRAEGPLGLLDRSSAPRTVANKTDARTVQLIASLRRLRFSGPEIAELLGRPSSTGLSGPHAQRDGTVGARGLQPAERDELVFR